MSNSNAVTGGSDFYSHKELKQLIIDYPFKVNGWIVDENKGHPYLYYEKAFGLSDPLLTLLILGIVVFVRGFIIQMIIQQFGKLVKQSIQVAMQCSCQLLQRKQVRMRSPASIINGCFCMFDINEIQDNAKQTEKTLNAITEKVASLNVEFKKIVSEYESHDLEYYEKHPKKLDEINEKIRKRLSVYSLMREVAEDLSEKTADDLESIMIEFQNGNYYKHD